MRWTNDLQHTDEANEARFLRIKALVERLADKDRSVWRNKVIDVRNRYDFAASAHLSAREENPKLLRRQLRTDRVGRRPNWRLHHCLVAAVAYQFDAHIRAVILLVASILLSLMRCSPKWMIKTQNMWMLEVYFKQFGLQTSSLLSPLDAKARVTEPFDRSIFACRKRS